MTAQDIVARYYDGRQTKSGDLSDVPLPFDAGRYPPVSAPVPGLGARREVTFLSHDERSRRLLQPTREAPRTGDHARLQESDLRRTECDRRLMPAR
jgi:hypothetical protein